MKVKLNICENAHLCQCLSSNCSHKEPHAETENCLRPCDRDYGYNGSKCIPYVEKRKVAKCFIEKQYTVDHEVVILFASYRWTGYYASRRAAIRGAKRFCATIGFKCEIVKEELS